MLSKRMQHERDKEVQAHVVPSRSWSLSSDSWLTIKNSGMLPEGHWLYHCQRSCPPQRKEMKWLAETWNPVIQGWKQADVTKPKHFSCPAESLKILRWHNSAGTLRDWVEHKRVCEHMCLDSSTLSEKPHSNKFKCAEEISPPLPPSKKKT